MNFIYLRESSFLRKKTRAENDLKEISSSRQKRFQLLLNFTFFCLVLVFILFHVASAISFAIKAKSERSSLVKAHLMLDCLHIFMRQKLLDRETWKYHFHILEEVWAWHSVICFFQAKMKIFLLFSWKNNFSSLFGAWMS